MMFVRSIFLTFMIVSSLNLSLGNNVHDQQCNDPSILFVVFNSVDEAAEIQCMNSTGELDTLLTDGGDYGSLSPDGSHIVYTITDSTGSSLFEYEMSLYVYEIPTRNSYQLRDGDGHIATNWVTSNDLIISTWDDTITTYAAFKPDHRFLYKAQSAELIELDWPVGNGARVVGYWTEEEAFVFADYLNGLSKITLDGSLTPISLPVNAYDTDFVMSPDSRSVAYRTKCDGEDVLANCLAIYELGTDNVEVFTAFAEGFESLGFFVFSPTGRFIAISLRQQSMIGIYDLEQKKIAFEFSESGVNGFAWGREEDSLFVAVVDDENENLSYIYIVHPLSKEIELAIDESVHWLGF